ncbi:ABC transporter component [Actinomyces sp. Chiba101]|uniref:ABC transporter substrate-binding protein n=1 Tax=Actinomyces TaxID=1654 RepID=UPI000974DCAD|nr:MULTISPECIES: ABC transporter substrate-binding protein [Actinomyces]BAW93253.1 ABC transporter component [Actinomyces sp. Chiba101]GAV95513.1 ABC transporter, ATP-binding protein [Actinomyces denticolens]SUU04072.1 Sulfate starvation-induced protein 7 [Actinomyces denticolens]
MRTTPTRIIAAVAALGLATGLSACTNANDLTTGSAKTKTQGYDVSSITKQEEIAALLPAGALGSDGALDIGAATDYAPAEFLDANGKPIGYDADLTQALGKVLGVDATMHSASFDSIIAKVGTEYDAGISSFSITNERMQNVDMIQYVQVGSQFNVAKGNPKGIDVSDHLNLCGKIVGVQTGTAQADAIEADSQACTAAGQDAIDVRSYDKQAEATAALAGSTLDATYSDSTVAGYAVETTDGAVETLGEVEDAAPQGVVLQKNSQIHIAIQAALQYLMDNGILTDILESWGVEDAALSNATLNPAVSE